MQPYRLTVDKFLDHAAKWFGDREIVEADAGRVIARTTYAELRSRSNRLSGALAALGLEVGDRVGTLAWNTRHHFEVYYGAMGMGAVCHTLNPRLTVGHLAQIINEAEDRVLAVASSLMSLTHDLLPLCPTIRHLVVLDEPPSGETAQQRVPAWPIEELLAAKGAPVDWGAFDEDAPAGLCYTSGTTGKPKGVLYTHRSNYLHTLRVLQADAAAPYRRTASPRPSERSPVQGSPPPCSKCSADGCRLRVQRAQPTRWPYRSGDRTSSSSHTGDRRVWTRLRGECRRRAL